MRVNFLDGPDILSDRARKAFQLAHQEAHRLRHPEVGVEHLLIGLVKEGMSPASTLLCDVGLDLDSIRFEVEKRRPAGPMSTPLPAALPYSNELDELVEAVVEAGATSEVVSVTPELLLLALIRYADGVAGGILAARRFPKWRIRRLARGQNG